MAYMLNSDIDEQEIEELNDTILALANQCGELQKKLIEIKGKVDEALHSPYQSIDALYNVRTEALEQIESIINQEMRK